MYEPPAYRYISSAPAGMRTYGRREKYKKECIYKCTVLTAIGPFRRMMREFWVLTLIFA